MAYRARVGDMAKILRNAVLLCFALLVAAPTLATSAPAHINPTSHANRQFGFQGARDVIRSFALTQSPIRLDTCVRELLESMDSMPLERLADLAVDSGATWLAHIITSLDRPRRFARARSLQPACQDRYAKAFAQAHLERRILTQAKATIFQEMRRDPAKRDDSAMYLLLAMLHFRLLGFYDTDALRIYIQAYIQKGGEIAKIPMPLRLLVAPESAKAESSTLSAGRNARENTNHASLIHSSPSSLLAPLSLESTLYALISQNLRGEDFGFFSHGFFASAVGFPSSSPESSELLFARVLELNQKQCVVLVRNNTQTELSGVCFPRAIDEVVLFPFDGRLYVLVGDTLYLISPSQDAYSLRSRARLVFLQEQGEKLCEILALDPKRQEHAVMDLTRAGFMLDSLEHALKAWSEEIAGTDVNMQVEYLGHLDVFNDGKPVPLARAYTTMGDRHERFYEAFTLAPATLRADISLSHPTMFLQGRIPSLRFVQAGGEILGCVRTPISGARPALIEEKLFRFHKNALPELVRHQRLTSMLTSIESLGSGVLDIYAGSESSPQSNHRIFGDARVLPIASIVKSKLDSRADSHHASHDYAEIFARAFGAEAGIVYFGGEILGEIAMSKSAYSAITACLSGAKHTSLVARSQTNTQAHTTQMFSPPQIQCTLESISAQIEHRLQIEK